ncbi:hypothetical protein RJ641_024386 [Dillenia turbinata]|uniref:Retrovirus-related Pol polyprotein from transposon TNT 1-94-like beta-barrel domain-containing protein n=1 Tax=Dillenia turbinata TaxID=194707 RepID=A0AAN8U8L4_9MAGN
MENLVCPPTHEPLLMELSILIVVIQSIPVRIASNYMVIQIGGMNSRLKNVMPRLKLRVRLQWLQQSPNSRSHYLLNHHKEINKFSHQAIDSNAWILDSGATDHMTYDAIDFLTTSPPRRTTIANANRVLSSVTGVGTVTLSLAISLYNTLLVHSLSHKLLSISQMSTNLNCVVLMYPTFFLLQDIHTKR